MLNDIVYDILAIIDKGFATVHAHSNNLMLILLTIDIVLFGISIAMGKKANIESIIEKILAIGVVIFLINNFENLAFLLKDSIFRLSSRVGGNIDVSFCSNPSKVLQFASESILRPLQQLIDKAPKGFLDIPDLKMLFIYFIASICTMICFTIIALQLAIATIEFHITVLMGLVIIPFIIFEPTRFIGEKVIPAVVGQAIKFGLIAIVTGLGITLFRKYVTVTEDALNIHFIFVFVAASVLMTFLALQIPALASSLLSGIPNLSVSGLMQNISGFANIARSASGVVNDQVGDRLRNMGTTAKDLVTESKRVINKYFRS